jgi:hypothetical protein
MTCRDDDDAVTNAGCLVVATDDGERGRASVTTTIPTGSVGVADASTVAVERLVSNGGPRGTAANATEELAVTIAIAAVDVEHGGVALSPTGTFTAADLAEWHRKHTARAA